MIEKYFYWMRRSLLSITSMIILSIDYLLINVVSKTTQYKYINYYYNQRKYFYEKKNNTNLYDWEKYCIDNFFQNRKNLLITSVGAGREAIALARMFKKIYATECNAKLLFRAKKWRPDNVTLLKLEPYDIPKDIFFENIIIGWGAYTHFLYRDDRILFLEKLNKICKKNGRLMLSFWADKEHEHLLSKTDNKLINSPVLGVVLNRKIIENEIRGTGWKLIYYSNFPYGHAILERQ